MKSMPKPGEIVVVTTNTFDDEFIIQKGKVGVVQEDRYGKGSWFRVKCEDGYENCYEAEHVEYVTKLSKVLA